MQRALPPLAHYVRVHPRVKQQVAHYLPMPLLHCQMQVCLCAPYKSVLLREVLIENADEVKKLVVSHEADQGLIIYGFIHYQTMGYLRGLLYEYFHVRAVDTHFLKSAVN